MVKKEAAAGLPWGGKGHYMGFKFQKGQSDGFTGVFQA